MLRRQLDPITVAYRPHPAKHTAKKLLFLPLLASWPNSGAQQCFKVGHNMLGQARLCPRTKAPTAKSIKSSAERTNSPCTIAPCSVPKRAARGRGLGLSLGSSLGLSRAVDVGERGCPSTDQEIEGCVSERREKRMEYIITYIIIEGRTNR